MITRDSTNGRLLFNGQPIVLRGTSYDPFTPGRSMRTVSLANGGTPVLREYAGKDPVQPAADKQVVAKTVCWGDANNDFRLFLGALRAAGCNFVRVFMTGGTAFQDGVPITLSPFRRVPTGGGFKYDVRGAVMNGLWDDVYFNRLRAFAAQAEALGVVVQLSLFNYFDVHDTSTPDFKAWDATPWNAALSTDAAWGAKQLIGDLAYRDRCREQVKPSNNLRAVQQALCERTVRAITGLGNVILEIMNEPHGFGMDELLPVVGMNSYFSFVLTRCLSVAGAHALIAVNALGTGTPEAGIATDMEIWKQHQAEYRGYLQIDMVNYHALGGWGYVTLSLPAAGRSVTAPRIDAASLQARHDKHVASHPDKALAFSTDAALVRFASPPPGEAFEHVYAGGGAPAMNLRDGQITVAPVDGSVRSQILQSDLKAWAKRCFATEMHVRGRAHFHDQSSFEHAARQIGIAAAESGV